MAWTDEQRRNAAIIAQVGRSLGASERDIVIAISAAIVESGLRNLDYGDRDSIGMFQQRDAWGSHSDRLDPYKSARMFFVGGAAGQRGLLDFKNRNQMGIGQAAQAVQVSAFPDRYQQHAAEAAQLAGAAGSVDTGQPPATGTGGSRTVTSTTTLGEIPGLDAVTQAALDGQQRTSPQGSPADALTADKAGIGEMSIGGQGGGPLAEMKAGVSGGAKVADPMVNAPIPDLAGLTSTTSSTVTTGGASSGVSGWRANVLAQARKMLGTPYVWGGTSYSGVDCSGLIKLLYSKNGFANMPRLSADQARFGRRTSLSKLKPGDLVAWDNSSRNNGADHIAIYIGNGQVIHAPHAGASVEISNIWDAGQAWGISLG